MKLGGLTWPQYEALRGLHEPRSAKHLAGLHAVGRVRNVLRRLAAKGLVRYWACGTRDGTGVYTRTRKGERTLDVADIDYYREANA